MAGSQRFGTIEIGGATFSAMMCVDVDRPASATFHYWGDIGNSYAARFTIGQENGRTVKCNLNTLFRINERGGIWVPTLTQEERAFAKSCRATLQSDGERLNGEWFCDGEKSGHISLEPPRAPSQVKATICKSWLEFKDWVSMSKREYSTTQFRGHGSSAFRLQTTLHRAGFFCLERYYFETLPEFKRHAEAILDMRINMDDGDDYSMLLGLAQHHGLPTPLLDLTESPYVAAFFAFADAIEYKAARPDATHVRIYALTEELQRFGTPRVTLAYFKPYVSPLFISARKNPRLYAQQGRFLVTNVSDLEGYLGSIESQTGHSLLVAADIPISSAPEALEDLRYMGLSAATMFPGLDGVCRMMRHSMLVGASK